MELGSNLQNTVKKIENGKQKFPVRVNLQTFQLANFLTYNFVMPNLDKLGVKLNNFIASIKKKTRID